MDYQHLKINLEEVMVRSLKEALSCFDADFPKDSEACLNVFKTSLSCVQYIDTVIKEIEANEVQV